MTQAATLAEISAVVLASGQWAGVEEALFSVDGVSWSPVFAATADNQHPLYARGTVHRVGAVAPTSVTISWAESLPEDDVWRERWLKRPMSLFGARAIRAAYRRAFGDIVEVVPNPDEGDDVPDTQQTAPAVDWASQIAAASTLDELEQLGKTMKRQRAFTTVLNRQWKARKAALAEPKTETALAESLAALEQRVAEDANARHARPTPAVLAKKRRKK